MSKKVLAGIGAALIALAVAVTAFVFLAKVQPTESEVRAAVQSGLPEGAVIDQMTFAVFSDDRSKGRVSVKGKYSFADDIFSLPTPPLKLMQALAPSQIFDREVATWWVENSGFYPQFNGKLGEFRKMYTGGQSIDFSGELPYLAIVDGTKIDGSGLKHAKFDGTLKPAFGYLDDATKIMELTKAIVEWRDIRRDQAAATEAARVAAAEAAAAKAAKVAEAEAAAAFERQLERERQEAQLAAARAAAEAAAIAAAELAAQKASARTEASDVRKDCGGQYAALRNCRNVYFGINENYRVESSAGVCPVSDPSNAGQWDKIARNQYYYIPARDGARITFFELLVGESFGGYTCK